MTTHEPISQNAIFAVEDAASGYTVRDIRNGALLRFSYQQPLYGLRGDHAVWGNYYSARGFAQKMQRAVTGACVAYSATVDA